MGPISPASQPILHYRLDPFEPGIKTRAKASDSTYMVTAQERRNLNRMAAEARVEGRIIIRNGMKFNRGLSGTTPTINAGQSFVTSVADTKPATVAPVVTRPRIASILPETIPGEAGLGAMNLAGRVPEGSGTGAGGGSEMDKIILDIASRKRDLRAELTNVEAEGADAADAAADAPAEDAPETEGGAAPAEMEEEVTNVNPEGADAPAEDAPETEDAPAPAEIEEETTNLNRDIHNPRLEKALRNEDGRARFGAVDVAS